MLPDNAADECSAALPDALFAGKEVCICIEGPKGAVRSAKLEGMLRGMGELRVNADNVVEWLTMMPPPLSP